MGQDKALLLLRGRTLLARTSSVLRPLVAEVMVIGRETLPPDMETVRCLADALPNAGPLAGIATALVHARWPYVLVVGCDAPLLNPELLDYLLRLAPGHDAVVPRLGTRAHPLHAVYDRRIHPIVCESLAAGERRVMSLLDRIAVRWVDEAELREIDPDCRSLINVNTPEEWRQVRGDESFPSDARTEFSP